MFKDSIRLLRVCAVLASLVSPLASAGVNSWTSIDGLPGGLVNRIAHHPTRPEIVYLTSNSGLYRSGNAGQSWQLVGNQPRSWPYDIAAHPANPDRVYVVANDSEVLTSDDAGVTFQLLSTFPFAEASNEIEICAWCRWSDCRIGQCRNQVIEDFPTIRPPAPPMPLPRIRPIRTAYM